MDTEDINRNNTSLAINLTTVIHNMLEYDTNKHGLTTFQIAEHVIYTRVILCISLCGIFGNLINLMVLTSKSMMKSMERMEMSVHIGLVSLAVSDMLYCICVLPRSFFFHSKNFDYRSLSFEIIYEAYGNAVINIFAMSSTWLTVSMAFSRYLAICHPLKARIMIGRRFARISTAVVYILSLLFNIPRFLEYSIAKPNDRSYFVTFGPMHSKINRTGDVTYTWCYFILCIFLPFTVLAFCNIFLIKEVRNAPKRIERRISSRIESKQMKKDGISLLTLTLTLIVLFYILLVTPAEVNKFIGDQINLKPSSYNLSIAITNTMESINFSFNFILYCAVNSDFRKVMKQVICKWPRCKSRQRSSESFTRVDTVDVLLETK